MAVISLDFLALAPCPRTNPAPAAKAETMCSAVAMMPLGRRLVLPSIARISPPRAGKMLLRPAAEYWRCLRTNNPLERLMREIRRQTRVVGAFPDGQSALMLVAARLRLVAATKWGAKRYLQMDRQAEVVAIA